MRVCSPPRTFLTVSSSLRPWVPSRDIRCHSQTLAPKSRCQHRCLDHVERPGEVDGENIVPILGRDFGETSVDNIESRVVDENIDAPQTLQQSLAGLTDLLAVGNIQCLDRGLPTDGFDLRCNLIELVAPAANEGDRGALLREHEAPALPIPVPAPVIHTTLPANALISLLRLGLDSRPAA